MLKSRLHNVINTTTVIIVVVIVISAINGGVSCI